MNYFELFDIKPSFNPDATQVKSKFYDLSRQYHPDRIAADGAENALEALQMAAHVNQAYKTLKDGDATMAYVLKIHGMMEDEEKYTLPPAFLMEMMDLNEAVSEYEAAPLDESTRLTAKNALAAQLQTWNDAAAPLTSRYNNGDYDDKLLLAIKDMYFRKKYLHRIQERMDKIS
ncbi:MAG: Fe-S protein assembly co-chaperone HscB [Taibaiella sp.]|nr:Fe-S protein assembly co-chaperone HscB [Taibaiella sp.]